MKNAFLRACFLFLFLLATRTLFAQNPYPNLEANAYLQKVVPEVVLTYLNDNIQAATQVSRMYNIPADFLLCVAGLETGWGKSELSRLAFNHFGIKNPYHEGPSYWILHIDYVPGVGNVQEYECFKQYSSSLESFIDYALHLQRRECYLEIKGREFAGFFDWVQIVSACGYATDPSYGQKLKDIRNRYFIDYLIPSGYRFSYNTAR